MYEHMYTFHLNIYREVELLGYRDGCSVSVHTAQQFPEVVLPIHTLSNTPSWQCVESSVCLTLLSTFDIVFFHFIYSGC